MISLGVTKQGNKIIGTLPFDFNNPNKSIIQKGIENIEFSDMQRELKEHYGNKNVFFDRDIENNRILFLT
ncbi:MAG: hypothetical protein ACJAVA_000305 [Flavobacteriaceae bacterium]|jgi:hypothetical protein